ncbi:MAG: hypothetical protein MZV63_17315 [Marinilabiliales bacterium]|nr:hypothetical protein [Marinilabiliales bacterium]
MIPKRWNHCSLAHTDVAALIIEPVLGNIGPVLPEDNYLQGYPGDHPGARCAPDL